MLTELEKELFGQQQNQIVKYYVAAGFAQKYKRVIGLTEFKSLPEMQPLLEFLKSEEERIAYSNFLVHLHNFQFFGSKIYMISEGLYEKMNQTNLKDVLTEFVKLPFGSILLKFPKPYVVNYSGSIVQYDEFIITNYESKIGLFTNGLQTDQKGRRFFAFQISLDHPTINECIDKSIADIEKLDGVQVDSVIGTADSFREYVRIVFSQVLKCILYINGANADIQYIDELTTLANRLKNVKHKKAAKIERKMYKVGVPKYFVGRKIILSRQDKEIFDSVNDDKSEHYKQTVRYMVQGHFRNQACGKEHLQRKVTWIEPYWRGPDFAEVINRDHLVK